MSYKIILEQYAKAVLEKEVEGFMAIYDPIVNVYDTWNSWIKKDIEEIRSMATEWFKSLGEEKVRVEFTEVNVLECESQTVWIGEVKFYGINQEDQILRSISNRWIWVIQNNDGIFKVIHEHSSLPIDTETFTGIVKTQ
ncbi:MAG: SnoaL-like domain-containing protein [Tissierellia bacterium]|nr:SnoaL-like domain-containing protein [Tissierellia bacterium]